MKSNEFAINAFVYAEDIKRARKKLKLSQKQFAQLVNVTINTVEKWKKRKEPIKGPIVTMLKLMKMLQMEFILYISQNKYILYE